MEWGIDGLVTLESTTGMDLGKVREHVGHRLTLVGNLDVARLLVHGAWEEIEDAVKNAIRGAARGGGYVLSPAHSHSSHRRHATALDGRGGAVVGSVSDPDPSAHLTTSPRLSLRGAGGHSSLLVR